MKLRNDADTARARLHSLTEKLSTYPDPENYPTTDELYNQSKSIDSLIQSLRQELVECEFAENQYKTQQESMYKIAQYKTDIDNLNSRLELLDKYTLLFAPNGIIVQSVFTKVAEIMTDGKFIIRTVKTLKSGEVRIDFDVDLMVGKYLIPYSELSGGQKTLVDIFFLTKLFQLGTRAGCLILDESLKELSEDKLEEVAKLLKTSRINTILLSTHVSSFNYYDRKLNVDMVDNRSTYFLEGNGS